MGSTRSVVYFAYLGDEGTDTEVVGRRLGFMKSQLSWLAGLVGSPPEQTNVVVAYTAPAAWDAEVHHAASYHGFQVDPASISSDRCNSFEYPGFSAMQALAAQADPAHPIYYCHSKGIAQLSPSKMGVFRLHTYIGLTADLALFGASPDITRAGMFPSKFGWCWYNFFWIKAGYMAALPLHESADRYYYEALIANGRDAEGYRGVLPLIDRLSFAVTGITAKEWYRAEETSSPALLVAYARFAGMEVPPSVI